MNIKAISVGALVVSGAALGLAGYTFIKERELSKHFDHLLDVLIDSHISDTEDPEIEDLDKEYDPSKEPDPSLDDYIKKEEETISKDAEDTVSESKDDSVSDSEPTGGIDYINTDAEG